MLLVSIILSFLSSLVKPLDKGFFFSQSDLSCILYSINACHILFKVSGNWKKSMKLNSLPNNSFAALVDCAVYVVMP